MKKNLTNLQGLFIVVDAMNKSTNQKNYALESDPQSGVELNSLSGFCSSHTIGWGVPAFRPDL